MPTVVPGDDRVVATAHTRADTSVELQRELERRLMALESTDYRESEAFRIDAQVMRSSLGYAIFGIAISVATLVAW